MAITEKKQIHPEYKNMKTKMKRQRQTELPRFTVGALAIAGASAASGATVQITFANNRLSSATGTTNFVGDLTGDGNVDMTGRASASYYGGFAVRVAFGYAVKGTGGTNASISAVGVIDWLQTRVSGVDVDKGLVPFTFSDPRINAGATTNGLLDVTASSSTSLQEIIIHRLIFDDAGTSQPSGVLRASSFPEWQVSAVPEPGSNLALLALGAGGLTLRRRLKRAA